MRVNDQDRLEPRRSEEDRRGDFGAALRRAEVRDGEARRVESGRSSRRLDQRLAATRGEVAPGREGGQGEVALARGEGGVAQVRGPGAGDPASGGGSIPAVARGATPTSGSVGAGPPSTTALAQAVRALPPVVEAFQASGRMALSLDFGGALGVELRQAAEGVEITLSSSAALRPAARAELAGLCRTLAARGVAVTRAEVRGGAPDRGRPRR
jgi:hypothetical protein